MGALIIILHVTLLLSSFSFTESSAFLQCFNDYDIELKCSFLSEPNSCSQYKLSVTRLKRLYTCHFIEIRHGECECRLEMKDGFVIYEILVIKLLKGDEIWHTTSISTEESIKPRRPIITSVIQKKNGDFSVNLNTTYPEKMKTFLDYLDVELQYGIVGSNVNVTEHVGNVHNSYEIVGRKLQPNSKYIIKARVKSNYPSNKMFSDYSEPFVFSTPQSLQNILRIIIPTLCILLIICISSVYFWFNRIIKPWWDEIPMPKFSTNFVKQVPQLLSFQTEFSSLSLDSLANHISKNTCVEVQSEDPYKFYNPSTGKGIEKASLAYLLASHQNMKTNGSEHTGFKHQSTNTNQSCRNQQSDELSSGIWKQESGISNKTYLLSKSSMSSIYKQPANQDSSKNSEVFSENLQMDFEYYKWAGSTTSGNYNLISIATPNTEMSVDLLYHSVGGVVDHKALSYCNDLIIEKSFNTKKPQDVLFSASDDILIPMEDGYQAI
ncbi:hypothetical protein Q7C36_000077 [Tachysurus vachellii]|uniref:Interleukin-4 receptor alpha N-terminal domain-containing protein n=1 Tax=Tachysurus vachellii TaxID=175792 RepID=A0AA88TIC8_TACVA|nr:hypothetical protein Q7C36_000077 [Tachysurus vachellii]